jgi:threonine dehydrogenase-like Zn-dependent dehydrogenase
MKAGQIVARRRVEIIDVPEPRLNGSHPGLVKIRVERSCLCGSDSPYFDYEQKEYPLPPGMSVHECLGTVVETTSAKFKEGDFVLALPGEFQGGLCEYFCTSDKLVIHLPREAVPIEQILLTQPLGTVIWACQKLGNLLDLDTVIIGQGPMGLLFAHMLSNLGARTIVAMDKIDYRLAAAKKMKATHTINIDREDPLEAVREITGGKMADLVVEAVGHQAVGHEADTFDLGLRLLRRLGTLLYFGVPDEELHRNFPLGRFFRQNLTLISSVGPNVVPTFSLARETPAQRRIDVSPRVTHILPFQEAQKAYELFIDRRDGAIKVVLNYDSLW